MKKIIFALCAFGLMCSLYAKKARVEGVYKGYECQDYCYMGFYTDKGEMWFWYMSNLQDFAQNEANIGKRFVVNYEIKKEYIREAGEKIEIELIESIRRK